ncbi:type IV secretion protein Rhs [Actinoplanes sp. ATCC 53533]|uniref:phage late control D family protein n=1 Tax=Actinoplanes sp. ATCC 53533 TaxID=1288362 RepID=UPI000F783F2E|nr:phage late control D family protein [Actinoplanes sp. ATCC 53533]RSM64731.1 type IV secretion protein Rhs [Actinoplanes sp. ATCC 53533]
MDVAPSLREIAPADRYAPAFSVRIKGVEADPATKGDVIDLKVRRDLEELSGFDLTMNNWDDETLTFKHSDTFPIGGRIEIKLGYAETELLVFTGIVKTLSPSFPDGASPTIAISGVDDMELLKKSKPSETDPKTYHQLADWQIARQVAERHKMRFVATEDGPVHELVVQKNQDDATFLVERAKRIDFNCYLMPGDDFGDPAVLHFDRPSDGRDSAPVRVFQFGYGPGLSAGARRERDRTMPPPPGTATQPAGMVPNLVSFTPAITLSEQVGKLTVRGWDRRTKKPITYQADVKDLPGGLDGKDGGNGPGEAAASLEGRQDMVIDAPVASVEEARFLATSLLRESAYEFITATGRVAGLPELRPGDNVEIFGVGARFSGSYFVRRVEHSLSSSGFVTEFAGRRVWSGDRG